MSQFPHLTDTESVRKEAAQQFGGLGDAAAFVQAHQASLDPNVSASAKKKNDIAATERVQADLSIAQDMVDNELGEGCTVLDAAVKTNGALSAVVEDELGRVRHVVVAYDERFKPIRRAAHEEAAAANAQAQAAKGLLSAEARAEVERRVSEAKDEILAAVGKLFGKHSDKVDEALREHLDSVSEQTADDGEDEPEGDDAGEGGGAAVGEDAKYPHTHDDLDALAKEHGFEWPEGVKQVAEKQDALREAGIAPGGDA